jgi:hypothetical protein
VRLASISIALLLLPAVAGAAPTGGIKQFRKAGISFTYASDWFVTTKPLSNGSSPDYRFAVATWPVHRTRRDQGPCLAGIASQRPPGGALVFLREYVGAGRRVLSRHPPRPRHFRAPAARDGDYGCLGKGSLAYYFRESGRAVILWISLSPNATDETRRGLRLVLSSLRILPKR